MGKRSSPQIKLKGQIMYVPTLSTKNTKSEIIESIRHGCDIAGVAHPTGNLCAMSKHSLLKVCGWVDKQVLKAI